MKESITKRLRFQEKNRQSFMECLGLFEKIKNDEVIIGLLLSDAYLRKAGNKNAYFCLEQNFDHAELVEFTEKHLKGLGVSVKVITRNRYDKRTKKTYHIIQLKTSSHVIFTKLYEIWYPYGKKIVPDYFGLTPKIIAFWFMGDGHATWVPHREKKVQLGLATMGFETQYVKMMQAKFQEIGFHFWLQKSGKSKNLVLSRSGEIYKFLKMMEPFMLECFYYKLKFPLVRTSSESATIRNLKYAKGRKFSKKAIQNIIIA